MQLTPIEWTDFSANPVDGLCLHKCWYCYEAQRRKRFHLKDKITFNPNWFNQKKADNFSKKYGRPAKIFVGSTHDLFGDWISKELIDDILDVLRENPQHIFQFLTKNPIGYWVEPLSYQPLLIFPKNCQLGLTIDTSDFNKLSTGELTAQSKIELLKGTNAPFKFISFEPLLSDMSGLDLNGINLAIIGAMTGQGRRNVVPKLEWIQSIEEICKRDKVKIFYKENIKKYLRGEKSGTPENSA